MSLFHYKIKTAFIYIIITACSAILHAKPEQGDQKKWTFVVYMAADNDLRGFAARNIKQMAAIGSNSLVNILVELHIKISGNKKITRRYFIEKNKILHVNADDPHSQRMDSGDPNTLISCMEWATTSYPAEQYALIFWNHGTGPLDPERGRIINPTELFTFNPIINKLELDRTIDFFEFIQSKAIDRGICWDDSTGNYINNQNLEYALDAIKNNFLGGTKIDLIGFDACLMASLEIGNIVKEYADVMVGSEEVELGAGWDYSKALHLLNREFDKWELAESIVHAYAKSYESITNDYTQSALNLNAIDALEKNVNDVAALLTQCLQQQERQSVTQAIYASKSKNACTHFDEPSYLDLHHLFYNLKQNIYRFKLLNKNQESQIIQNLSNLLEEGCALIRQIVFVNAAGKNLKFAQGISIYFPDKRIHPSYPKTNFAHQNQWAVFLQQYLQTI